MPWASTGADGLQAAGCPLQVVVFRGQVDGFIDRERGPGLSIGNAPSNAPGGHGPGLVGLGLERGQGRGLLPEGFERIGELEGSPGRAVALGDGSGLGVDRAR